MSMASVVYREASTPDDLRRICILNHQTFAAELGQHTATPSGLLIDRFHESNRYFIAAKGDEVLGMISAHAGPEFSVARKLQNPALLKQFPSPLEVRLLAIAPDARKRTLLAGLLWMVYEHAVANGHSHLLISGITDRERMYHRLGFQSLGPAVRDGVASFIPMAMQIGNTASRSNRALSFERYWSRTQSSKRSISLLPGPVNIGPAVKRSFIQEPISHRSEAFLSMFEETRTLLRALVPGLDVAIFPGSGTLANDLVAANLKALFADAPGVVVSNGEFGERLADQAARAGLTFKHHRFPWGESWDWRELQESLQQQPHWVWAVHLETSTGVLNDVDRLLSLAASYGAFAALDCVSSLGAVPIPALGPSLHMITGVSGKSLGSYAGLGIVYLSDRCKGLLRNKPLPSSFDLVRITEAQGPITTIPSPQLLALREALLQHYASPGHQSARFHTYESLGKVMRHELTAAGLVPLCREEIAAPTITTFFLPDADFVSRALREGYQIAHESSYLRERGWVQIATMGDMSLKDLDGLISFLRKAVSRHC